MSVFGKRNAVKRVFSLIESRKCWSKCLDVGGKSLYSTSNDWEYLERSVAPTDVFQHSLPRLKIPSLDLTMERYLKSQRVILNQTELDYTQKCVSHFMNNGGAALQMKLVAEDRKNKRTSYVSVEDSDFLGDADPWFDMYLESRLPIVLNYNPFMTFVDDPRPEYRTQLIRATNMVISSLRMLKSLKENVLKPEVFHLAPDVNDTEKFLKFCRMVPNFVAWHAAILKSNKKAFPLDMSQFGRLFGSTRIPKQGRDEFLTKPHSKHLLVMRNGHFYVVNVLDDDGHVVKPDTIMAHLQYIQQQTRSAPEFPIGPLSAEDRDTWASLRQQLIDAGNQEVLDLIDTAIFALVLDDTMSDEPNEITRQFLHGDGVNRWFDKSFSLIMMSNSRACVNFEHAWGDGVAVLRYFNEIFKDSIENSFVHPSTTVPSVDSACAVKHLEFKLDSNLQQSLKKAKENFDKLVGSLDVHHLEYTKYHKNYVKEKRIGPDSIMQLAIQMAYYRQYGHFVGTYESCSTSAFKHGRTETIRAATLATKQACERFVNPGNPSVDDLLKAITECSKVHNSLTTKAAMGEGWDRHLFALKNLAKRMDLSGDYLQIFKDPSYAKINHIILSTSTLSSPAVVIGGFAPVVPDGYGIGYAIEKDRIGFNVTSYPPHNNVRDFIECLRISLDDMYEVMEGRLPKRQC